MKILVLGGSPKGKLSVTMEHVRIMESHMGNIDFDYAYPAQAIKKLERDEKAFDRLMDKVEKADIVLMAMPVYIMVIPSGFKRFIELVNERNKAGLFRKKSAGVLLTSIHFFDHTALNYLQATCEDWNCNWAGGLSLGMHDVLKKKNREELLAFGLDLIQTHDNPPYRSRRFAPLPKPADWTYAAAPTRGEFEPGDKKIVLLTDGEKDNPRLAGMVEKTISLLGDRPAVYRIGELMKGSCLGCLKCGQDNRCAWEGKDPFIDAFKEWMEADVLIMAGVMKDRYLSSTWKSWFDRSFWRTHQSSFTGKQIIWMISGPLSHEQNLQEVLLSYTEWQGARLTGMISDECGDSALLDGILEDTLKRAVDGETYRENRAVTFRRVGGYRIFRDDVYGGLKIIFRRDHRTYGKTGIYDFPQKKPLRQFFVNLGYIITGLPFIQKRMRENMPRLMIRNYSSLYRKE